MPSTGVPVPPGPLLQSRATQPTSSSAPRGPQEDRIGFDLKAQMRKVGVANMTTAELFKTWESLKDLMSMLRYKRFIIDYEKTLFDICYDFLRFCIERSGLLDILCRPWAPEPSMQELQELGQLPSWIRRLSSHGTFAKLYGGPMERINADPLVGRSGTGEKRLYTADRGIRATFRTVWDQDQMAKDRETAKGRDFQRANGKNRHLHGLPG
jgi:hypothetical protein